MCHPHVLVLLVALWLLATCSIPQSHHAGGPGCTPGPKESIAKGDEVGKSSSGEGTVSCSAAGARGLEMCFGETQALGGICVW